MVWPRAAAGVLVKGGHFKSTAPAPAAAPTAAQTPSQEPAEERSGRSQIEQQQRDADRRVEYRQHFARYGLRRQRTRSCLAFHFPNVFI